MFLLLIIRTQKVAFISWTQVILELNNLRIIGNAYAHLNGNEERDAYNDRLTCYVAIKEISSWLVKCKKEYPAYQAKQEAERKEWKEKSKKFWKTVGKVLVGIAGVAVVILGGKKIFGRD